MSQNTLSLPPPRPKHKPTSNSSASSFQAPLSRPYSHFFFYNGHWTPSAQLRGFARECPEALMLWSLHSPGENQEDVLVCNLVQGGRDERERLRNKLWSGALVRFEHPDNKLNPYRRHHALPLNLAPHPASQSPQPGGEQHVCTPETFVCELQLLPGVLGAHKPGCRTIVFGLGQKEEPSAAIFSQLVEARLLPLEVPDWDSQQPTTKPKPTALAPKLGPAHGPRDGNPFRRLRFADREPELVPD